MYSVALQQVDSKPSCPIPAWIGRPQIAMILWFFNHRAILWSPKKPPHIETGPPREAGPSLPKVVTAWGSEGNLAMKSMIRFCIKTY